MNESCYEIKEDYDANEFFNDDDEDDLYDINEINEYFPIENDSTKYEEDTKSEIGREPLTDKSNVIEVFDTEYNTEHVKEMGIKVSIQT